MVSNLHWSITPAWWMFLDGQATWRKRSSLFLKPIRIYKNLRVWSDCHTATKFITKVTEREIMARDAKRFHHFCAHVVITGNHVVSTFEENCWDSASQSLKIFKRYPNSGECSLGMPLLLWNLFEGDTSVRSSSHTLSKICRNRKQLVCIPCYGRRAGRICTKLRLRASYIGCRCTLPILVQPCWSNSWWKLRVIISTSSH